ncbi:MAG TPA: hypothetical protein VD905_12240 [Flavobacteriales bacterium]|nr:hypothetical protein [Flavobacteriales bacterium]
MNYWKHSLLSKKKFGGSAHDYLSIHKFMDSSKLYFFDIKHRALLHNTYGIDLCIMKFGDFIVNAENKTILVRDIAAEHCKEDLLGVVPTLAHWFRHCDTAVEEHIAHIQIQDNALQEFLVKPYIMSGLKSSLMITHSNFGVYLVNEFFDTSRALDLANQLQGKTVDAFMPYLKLRERWQYSPDLKQLKTIDNELLQ